MFKPILLYITYLLTNFNQKLLFIAFKVYFIKVVYPHVFLLFNNQRHYILKDKSKVEFYNASIHSEIKRPEFDSRIKAGFPSPVDDYIDKELDLNELIIKHPASTFFIRVSGDSMINAGINTGDLLVIDRSIEPRNNKIVLAVIDGEFTVKRYTNDNGIVYLMPENNKYNPIQITDGMNFDIIF